MSTAILWLQLSATVAVSAHQDTLWLVSHQYDIATVTLRGCHPGRTELMRTVWCMKQLFNCLWGATVIGRDDLHLRKLRWFALLPSPSCQESHLAYSPLGHSSRPTPGALSSRHGLNITAATWVPSHNPGAAVKANLFLLYGISQDEHLMVMMTPVSYVLHTVLWRCPEP
jgi:hypothetical protein